MDSFVSTIKKALLAGVGAAAITVEKSNELLDELIEKGAVTVEQGKAINEELKYRKKSHDFDDMLDNMTSEQLEELKAKILQRENDSKGTENEDDTETDNEAEPES